MNEESEDIKAGISEERGVKRKRRSERERVLEVIRQVKKGLYEELFRRIRRDEWDDVLKVVVQMRVLDKVLRKLNDEDVDLYKD